MNSVNIDIRVTRNDLEEHAYLVVATTARQKVAQKAFRFSPEHWQDLELSLKALNARAPLPIQEPVRKMRDYGQKLFDYLFQGEVQKLYDEKKREAMQSSKVLRVRLILVPLELVVLPWECLFDARQSEYLCLTQHPKTVLIRSIDRMRSLRPSKHDSPLRILGMIAEPIGLDPLESEKEKRAIDDALQPLVNDGYVYLEWKRGSDQELYNLSLSEMRWDAFHFIGHGGFNEANQQGMLIFEDVDRHPKSVPADQFRMSLPAATRLVVLNACETARGSTVDYLSSIAHSLAHNEIPAVVAMQFKILDTASNWFSKTLYTLLARGIPIDEAVAEARWAIRKVADEKDRLDWAAPLLYMSSPNVLLFQLPGKPEQIETKSPTPEQIETKSPMPERNEPKPPTPGLLGPTRRGLLIGGSIGALGLLAGGALATFAWTRGPDITIVVGSKLDPESELLGTMYILLLKKEGFLVKSKLKLGDTDVVFSGLENGTIDVYPEFLQEGLKRLNIPTTYDPKQDFQQVKDGFLKKNQMTWLEPAFKLNDIFCAAMLQSTAKQLNNITTLSDLATVMHQQSSPFKIAVAPNYEKMLARLQEEYGITFLDENILKTSIEGTFNDVMLNKAQMNICYSASPFIAKYNFVRLVDDKAPLLVDAPSPLVRNETLEKAPRITMVLNRLAPKLTTEVSIQLQQQMLDEQSAHDVAEKWLKDQRLL
jgi:osmoprotectant transport system substrate-binding protein